MLGGKRPWAATPGSASSRAASSAGSPIGAAVVGDRAAVGAGGDVAQLDLGAEPGQGRGDAEGEQLQRHRPAQGVDRLAGVGDDDEALGRRGDDLLAQVGGPAALDQPAVGGDLVGAVDRDVEPLQAVELLDRDPQLARLFLGRDRGGDAADAARRRGGRSPAAGGRPSSRSRARPSSRPRPAPRPPRPPAASPCRPRSPPALYPGGRWARKRPIYRTVFRPIDL